MFSRVLILLVPVLVVVTSLVGCSREEPEISLPQTPVLSGQASYALITEAYVRLFDRPEIEGAVIGHARRGDVLAVVSITADRRWIEVDGRRRHGWVSADFSRLFSGREQALNAQALLDE